jgi:hypothetical protein
MATAATPLEVIQRTMDCVHGRLLTHAPPARVRLAAARAASESSSKRQAQEGDRGDHGDAQKQVVVGEHPGLAPRSPSAATPSAPRAVASPIAPE